MNGPPPSKRRPAISPPSAEPTDSLAELLEQIPRHPGGRVPASVARVPRRLLSGGDPEQLEQGRGAESIDRVSRAGAVRWSDEQRAASGLRDPGPFWFVPLDAAVSDREIDDLVRRVPRR